MNLLEMLGQGLFDIISQRDVKRGLILFKHFCFNVPTYLLSHHFPTPSLQFISPLFCPLLHHFVSILLPIMNKTVSFCLFTTSSSIQIKKFVLNDKQVLEFFQIPIHNQSIFFSQSHLTWYMKQNKSHIISNNNNAYKKKTNPYQN